MSIRKTLQRWQALYRSWLHLCWLYCLVGYRFWFWRHHLIRHLSNDVRESIDNHSMKRTLLFIRHGQTTWNIEHRLPGQLPGVALTETGKQQAARLAEALSILPISAIITSPLERARDTAEYLLKGRELSLRYEPDLMDTNIGNWAGQKIDDLVKSDPAWSAYVKDPTQAPEDVETFPQVQQRVVAAIERWLTYEGTGDYLAFVAHADVIKLLIAYYSGLEVKRAGSLFIDNASVSIVEIEPERTPHILSIGWCPQPGWLKPPVPVTPQSEHQKHEQETGEQKT